MKLNLSESARATSAEEARFRINAPNSRPRVSRIIALDEQSLSALRPLRDQPWSGARFLRFVRSMSGSASLPNLPIDAVLEDFDGVESDLSKELAEADIIVMVTAAGSAPKAAEIIGNACFVRGKRVTGLVLNTARNDGDLSKTLAVLRPYATMLVVSSGTDYVGEMLRALRV